MPKTNRESCFTMYVVFAVLDVFWIVALVWALMDENYFAMFLAGALVASYSTLVMAGFSDVFGHESKAIDVHLPCSQQMADEIFKAGKYYGAKDLEDSIILATVFLEKIVKEQTENGKVIVFYNKEKPEDIQIFGSFMTDKDIYEGLGLNDENKKD